MVLPSAVAIACMRLKPNSAPGEFMKSGRLVCEKIPREKVGSLLTLYQLKSVHICLLTNLVQSQFSLFLNYKCFSIVILRIYSGHFQTTSSTHVDMKSLLAGYRVQ